MSERQAPYSPDRAQDLHDAALDTLEDVEYIERQLELCLDVLDDGPEDLGGLEERYASLARKLRNAADQLDPHR